MYILCQGFASFDARIVETQDSAGPHSAINAPAEIIQNSK